MRLSGNERRILARLGTQALAPIQERAALCGLKEHTVRNTVRRLAQRSLLEICPVINFHALGLIPYRFYFSLHKKNSAPHHEVIERLKMISCLLCIEELAGEFEVCIHGCVSSVGELEQVLTQISEYAGVQFLRKSLACSSEQRLRSRRYLDDRSEPKSKAIVTAIDTEGFVLDDLDRCILQSLLSEKYTSCRQLAKRLCLPAETVRVRLKRLELSGVIAGWNYVVDLSALAIHSFRVMLTSEQLGTEVTKDIMHRSQRNPHLVEIRRCISDWDFELTMETERAEQFMPHFQQWLRECSDLVAHTRVLSVLKSHKGACNFLQASDAVLCRAVA